MGLNFSKPAETQPQAVPATTAANEIEEVKEYDIVADRLQMNEQLVNSPEVDAIVSTIEIHNLESI
ncbi:MAG: toxic anion resistance protein, partial [Ruminococcus sp.]|nr:toxic anion resistance protein [Ruminococcus sp.]